MIVRTTTDLAHLIRDRRSRLSLTQANLADLVGVSRKWIVELEAGKRTADVSLILRTIRALGLELDIRVGAKSMDKKSVEIDEIVERSKRAPG